MSPCTSLQAAILIREVTAMGGYTRPEPKTFEEQSILQPLLMREPSLGLCSSLQYHASSLIRGLFCSLADSQHSSGRFQQQDRVARRRGVHRAAVVRTAWGGAPPAAERPPDLVEAVHSGP